MSRSTDDALTLSHTLAAERGHSDTSRPREDTPLSSDTHAAEPMYANTSRPRDNAALSDTRATEKMHAHPIRPHDLARLTDDTPPFPDAPSWVASALARAPFVVARRAPRSGAAIAIGIRGATRAERFGAWIAPHHLSEILAPEDLRRRPPHATRASLPCFALLRDIAPILDATGLAWGPAGSAGFELASGVATVTPASDLDLIVRAPQPLPRDEAAALFDALSHAAQRIGTRIDVQIETPDAAFSLAEFARRNLRVMLRHADGPRLCADPWSAR